MQPSFPPPLSPSPTLYITPFSQALFSLLNPITNFPEKEKEMIPITSLFLATLLLTASLGVSTRPGSSGPFSAELKHSKDKGGANGGGDGGNNGGNNGGMGGFLPPGFDIPGFGKGFGNGVGGGYGAGYGGPNGGSSKGGTVRTSVVCKEKGPCYKKKLTCPAKCFTSYSRSGKGYGGGGGGGGCTIDCKKKCNAYC